MSSSQEQDYILGLPAPCPGIASDEKLERSLKGTELRLGLPGSESPERKIGSGSFSLFGKELRDERRSDGFSCGEMGFFYDMNASSKWVSSVDAQEDGDFARIGNETFLPSKGCSSSSNLGSYFAGNTHKPGHGKDETEADTFPPASRERVVGWPPIRSFRKPTSSHQSNKSKISPVSASSNHFIKVSMDGAPYLRKIDLKTFSSYAELSATLQGMFSFFTLGPNDQSLSGLKGDNSSGTEYVLTYEDKDGDWMLVGDVPWEMFMTSCNRLRIVNRSEAIGLGELMHFKVKMVCDQEPN